MKTLHTGRLGRAARRTILFAILAAATAAHADGWCIERLQEAEEALVQAEAEHGSDSYLIVDALLDVGDAQTLVEDYAAAKQTYRRAAALQQDSLKEIQGDLIERVQRLVMALNGIGAACLERREFERAEHAYNRALGRAGLALSPARRAVKVARNGFSLARAYFMRFEVARKFYDRLLESCKNAFGPEDPEICRVLEAQVEVHKHLQDLDEAETAARNLVRMRRNIMPPDHPKTAVALNMLASILYEQGHHGEALPLLKEALAIRQKAFGKDHLKAAIAMNNVAALLREMGTDEEAAKYEAAAGDKLK